MDKLPQIVLGTYEQFLLGYEVNKSDDGSYTFSLNMASHAHMGSIRSVAVDRHFLASAGADEYINIFSMVNRKEVAVLTPHEGTITSVLFTPDGTHLITGSQDGTISIFRCKDWKVKKSWKNAHKKPNGVVGLAIHPSGKLLLSIGADHIMRVWNLVKGRQAFAVNFSKKITAGNTLNLVTWSRDGSHYAVAIGNTAEVYDTASAAVVYVIKGDSKISCFDSSMVELLSVGRDDGKLAVHNYVKKEQVLEHAAHEGRVKCFQLFWTTGATVLFVSADSQGVIRLWRWKKNRQTQRLTQEGEVNADCRIVCMAILNPDDLMIEEGKAAEKQVVPPVTPASHNGTPKELKLISPDFVKSSSINGSTKKPMKPKEKGNTPVFIKSEITGLGKKSETNSKNSLYSQNVTPKKVKEISSEFSNSNCKSDSPKTTKILKMNGVTSSMNKSETISSGKKRKSGFNISSINDAEKEVVRPKRKSISTSQWNVT